MFFADILDLLLDYGERYTPQREKDDQSCQHKSNR